MNRSIHLAATGIFLFFLVFPIPSITASNDDCLACHEDPDLKSGKGKPLFVNPEKFRTSVHDRADFSCIDCHRDLKGVDDFPHAETLQPVTCEACHKKAAEQISESVHGPTRNEKNVPAVGCKDCHGTHDIKSSDDYDSQVFSINIPRTCEECHLKKVKTKRGQEFIKTLSLNMPTSHCLFITGSDKWIAFRRHNGRFHA